MTAVNPMQPTATPPRDQRAYEPSMEEILASIRRIIADDQSLPSHGTTPEPSVALAEPTPPEPVTAGPNHSDVHVLHPVDAANETGHARDHAESARVAHEPIVEAPSFAAHGTIAPQYATPEGPVYPSIAAPHGEAVPDAPAPAIADRALGAEAPPDHREPAEAVFEARDIARPHQNVEDATAQDPPLDNGMDYDRPLGRHEPIPFEPAALFSPATDQALTSAFNTLAATRLADNTDDLLAMTREMIRPLLKTWLDDNLPSMVERLVRAEIERVARGGR